MKISNHMPHIFRNLCIALLLSASSGCKQSGSNLADFNQNLYSPEYASGFEISGATGKESVLITVTNPWQGADSVVTELLIARNGESVPDGFDGQVLTDEARRIVAMSSSHIAMLDAIGETDRIVGVSGIDYITTPAIQARRDSIGDVGYEGNVNYERLLSLEPDIVLLYGVNGASTMEGKLKELGIPYIYIGDYLEESPLGKAEWSVVLSELTDRRNDGKIIFSQIPKRYNKLKATVDSLGATARPKVMLNAPYGDTWFMPPAGSYMVRLINDAGGDYLFQSEETTKSVPVDKETAYLMSSQADVWLNSGSFSSTEQIGESLPQWASLEVVKGHRVYNNTNRRTPAGGNDFFESGAMRPDEVLADLIKILHPGLLNDSTLTYYTRLK